MAFVNIGQIPQLHFVNKYDDIAIVECEESLIRLEEDIKIKVENTYFQNGIIGSENMCFVRSTVAKMLLKASNRLPDNYIMLVKDGWRSYELQLAIYKDMYDGLKARKPYLSNEELHNEISIYVSKGSLNPNNPSPHFTGGAVDISLGSLTGVEVNMGSGFDQICPESATRFYEEKLEEGIELTRIESEALYNRRLLFHCMADSGFTNYSNEWWHFDYGNQLWAKIKNTKALYGLIRPSYS